MHSPQRKPESASYSLADGSPCLDLAGPSRQASISFIHIKAQSASATSVRDIDMIIL